MVEEYEWEEIADMAIEDLRDFVDTEQRFVKGDHELVAKLYSWDYIIEHLEERIPPNMTHLHRLTRKISLKLIEIRDIVQSGGYKDIIIEQEEEDLINKLEEEVGHRNWKARRNKPRWRQYKRQYIRNFILIISRKQGKVLRLELHELKELHSKFQSLAKLMRRKKVSSEINKDLTTPKQKEQYENLLDYYFVQIYKFAITYQRIFSHLWQKERILSEKLKKDSKGI